MSNIIPMVSSSPPPMDEGGGFGWDDDDDDFGTFTSAGDSSFSQSDTTAKADTSIPDHINSEPHTNESDDFADFASFPSNTQPDTATMHFSKTQSIDHRPESINISHKPSDNDGLNDTDNGRNNYHNVNGQLIDSGVYSSNVSPVQYEENSGANHLANNGEDIFISKSQPHDNLSCRISEKIESSSLENEISDNNSDTGRVISCDDTETDTQDASVVNDSDTKCVTESQDNSIKCIPPKDIPENDHVQVSGSLKTDEEVTEEDEEKSASANVVILNNCDSSTEDSTSSDNICSVSNFSNQESGHEQSVNCTDLNTDIPNVKVNSEEEINERNSSDFGSFSSESVKSLEKEREQVSESLHPINTETENLGDQLGAAECISVQDGGKDRDTNGLNNADKNVNISCEESMSVRHKCEISTSPDQDKTGLVSGIETVKGDSNLEIEQEDISCESRDDITGQSKTDSDSVSEDMSKSVEDLKLDTDDFEEDNYLQDEPVSDNNNSNSKEEPSGFNAVMKQSEDIPISENADDDFGDFSTTNVASEEELRSFNKIENDEADSEEFGEFNANFETKLDNDNLEPKEDDDFGDFNANFDAKPEANTSETAENNEEFGDFNATFPENSNNKESSEDDFGDFNATFDSAPDVNEQTNDWAAFSEPQTVTHPEADDEDDDDWAGFEGGDSTPSVSESVSTQNKVDDTSKFANMTKHEKLLYAVTTCFPALITDMEEYDINMGELQDLHINSSSQVWGQVKGQETTEALSYQWTKSLWNSQLFSTLHIDTKNILIGHKKTPVPVYAAGLTLLEPTKGQTSLKPDVLVDTSNASIHSTSQDSIPAAQFDWSSSGLTNPLEANNKTLNLDFLIQDQATKSNALESEFLSTNDSPVHKPAIQPLENILANLKTSSTYKPTNQNEDVSKEASKVLLSLPDLMFMKSKVLMFPVKLDGVEN